VNNELKDWPGYEEHFTSGFVKHKGYTHMARKARSQMLGTNIIDAVRGPKNLWVMSKESDNRDEVEAVMVAVFCWVTQEQVAGWGRIPARRKEYVSATLNLPLQRRLRTGTAMLKRCEDCIQELMVWHKMENM
jgi:hypothetical protein